MSKTTTQIHRVYIVILELAIVDKFQLSGRRLPIVQEAKRCIQNIFNDG